ncbi:ABC transporter ATP-binding protein [Oleomonas cavernae]|uniref:ABC transporter ATP-binding protein n=1 Tax=Oleomonas cavernae TaxID=2320859 RepID=A0A418W9S1_9PROT|nr:ABC transporter ATP-binding protein [Oleomonas cavernae]RJF86767.1 ABC transporter ATP-binding protein [Oleomonas cavernae]
MSKPVAKRGDTLLTIRGLHIEARTSEGAWTEIVHGVDLDLRRGEVLGLIGESGAGKSTIGLAAMGFARDGCRITRGSIVFDGTDLATAGEKQKRGIRGARIAYVAQSAAAAFNPAHRLIDQFAEGPVRHGVKSRAQSYADAIDLYRRMQLPEPETIGFRYPHQVSGGQLQRAMTAMAMACRPDLIIFDEPTTALDVTTQIEVLASIKDIVRQFHTAAIYITHDLAVVAQMADRIKVLQYGREVEEAEAATMLAAPRETYTRSLWAVRGIEKDVAPQPVTAPVLSVQNVTASYGKGFRVLEEVSLDVHLGRTVAVVGESGSGKSTMARVVSGLLPPSSGQVLLDGNPLPPALRQRSRAQRQRIQMIYQMADTALNPRQRIKEIIGRPVQFYLGLGRDEVTRRVADLLEMIELPKAYADRYPGELSGGQKQRIGIARALAANPEIVICDEVTSALDQLVAEGILKLLMRLQRELKLSYVFITHELSTVRAIADDIVVMHRGRVVDAGSKQAVLSPPFHDYTARLLASVPEMDTHWLDKLLAARAS